MPRHSPGVIQEGWPTKFERPIEAAKCPRSPMEVQKVRFAPNSSRHQRAPIMSALGHKRKSAEASLTELATGLE